jgi:hypothetical protein
MAVVPAAAWAVVAISVAGAILAVQWVAEALAAVLEVALGRLLAEGAVLRQGATLTSAGSVSVRDISAGGQDSSAIVIFVFSSSAARAGFGAMIHDGGTRRGGWIIAITNGAAEFSPVTLQVPLHHTRPAADRKLTGGLLRDRSCECGAGQREPEPRLSKMRCRIQFSGGIFGKRAMSPANWTQGCALSQ